MFSYILLTLNAQGMKFSFVRSQVGSLGIVKESASTLTIFKQSLVLYCM